MSDAEVWLSIALGVFIAVIYPVLYRYIRKEFPPTAGLIPSWLKDQVKIVRRFGGVQYVNRLYRTVFVSD